MKELRISVFILSFIHNLKIYTPQQMEQARSVTLCAVSQLVIGLYRIDRDVAVSLGSYDVAVRLQCQVNFSSLLINVSPISAT